MYIVNPEKIHNKIKTNEFIGKYLIKKGISILSKDGNIFYFANTEELQKIMDDMPIWISIWKFLP